MKVLEDTETLRFSFNFNLQKVDSIDELLSVYSYIRHLFKGTDKLLE